jgi:hypothetical protein
MAWARPLVAGLLAVWVASPGWAQETPPPEAEPEAAVPIPEPTRRPPVLAGELFLEGVLPLATSPVCPAGAACVLGAGLGVGGIIERRWASGTSLGAAYDLWFLDGGAVHEVTVMQSFKALLRHRFMPTNQAHPYVGAGAGALFFGDSFGFASAAVMVEGHLGVEIEMSPSLAVTISTVWRLFVATPFRTEADGVRRVQDQGPNLAATLRLGLVIL